MRITSILKYSFLNLFFLIQISCKEEKEKKELNLANNIEFKDINNKYYKFEEFANEGKSILLIAFNINCFFEGEEIKRIKKIDSLYHNKIKVIGIDCSQTIDTSELSSFLVAEKINFNVTKLMWNKEFERILFPDSLYAVPKIVLLNNYLDVIYFQDRALVSTIDSIKSACNIDNYGSSKKTYEFIDITDKCIFPKESSYFCSSYSFYKVDPINDQLTWKAFEDSNRCFHRVNDTSQLLYNLDFENNTLLINYTLGSGCFADYKRIVLEDKTAKKIIYRVEVDFKGRCSAALPSWNIVLVPKISVDYTVEIQTDVLNSRCFIKKN